MSGQRIKGAYKRERASGVPAAVAAGRGGERKARKGERRGVEEAQRRKGMRGEQEKAPVVKRQAGGLSKEYR